MTIEESQQEMVKFRIKVVAEYTMEKKKCTKKVSEV